MKPVTDKEAFQVLSNGLIAAAHVFENAGKETTAETPAEITRLKGEINWLESELTIARKERDKASAALTVEKKRFRLPSSGQKLRVIKNNYLALPIGTEAISKQQAGSWSVEANGFVQWLPLDALEAI